MNQTQTIDLGPKALETGSNNPFLLQQKEFTEVQLFVENGQRLPATSQDWLYSLFGKPQEHPEMAKRLKIASAAFPIFPVLGQTIKSFITSCTNYKEQIYTDCITFANDVIAYSSVVENIYQQLEFYSHHENVEMASSKISALLQELRQKVQTYTSCTHRIYQQSKRFMEDTEELSKKFQSTYKNFKQNVFRTFHNAYYQLQPLFKQARLWLTEYNEKMEKSHQPPEYLWHSLLGLIPSTEQDNQVKDLLQRAATIQQSVWTGGYQYGWQNMIIIGSLALEHRLDGFVEVSKQAMTGLQKMCGIWLAIDQDVAALEDRLQHNVKETQFILQKLGLQNAIRRWKEIAAKTEQYKERPWIKITTG